MKKKAIVGTSAVAGIALAGTLAFGATANADDPTASASPSSSAGTNDEKPRGKGGGAQDTEVTGDEAQKVIDAVVSQNSGVTIEKVRKDPDGSYDALGTDADGSRVFFDVSADLATVTQAEGHGKGRGGKGGGAQDTEVTGDEAQKVIDAVVSQNSGVTIEKVRKDPDGSYDALGTDADGSRVFFDVSADLATVTQAEGHGKGRGGKGGGAQDTEVTGDEAQKVIDAVVSQNSGVTIEKVRKDPDGSYDALGTDADGSRVFFDVSSDLGTITARGTR